jgi:hypothetical protein
MSRYIHFTKLKHLIFLNGGSTLKMRVRLTFELEDNDSLSDGDDMVVDGQNKEKDKEDKEKKEDKSKDDNSRKTSKSTKQVDTTPNNRSAGVKTPAVRTAPLEPTIQIGSISNRWADMVEEEETRRSSPHTSRRLFVSPAKGGSGCSLVVDDGLVVVGEAAQGSYDAGEVAQRSPAAAVFSPFTSDTAEVSPVAAASATLSTLVSAAADSSLRSTTTETTPQLSASMEVKASNGGAGSGLSASACRQQAAREDLSPQPARATEKDRTPREVSASVMAPHGTPAGQAFSTPGRDANKGGAAKEYSNDEVVAFGGIPAPSADIRSSSRIRAQDNADLPQMERAMRMAQLRDSPGLFSSFFR